MLTTHSKVNDMNHVGARHCRKPLGRRKGLNMSTVGIIKTRAFLLEI